MSSQAVPEESNGATPIESLRQFTEYHWLMIKVFVEAISRNHGEDAALRHLRAG